MNELIIYIKYKAILAPLAKTSLRARNCNNSQEARLVLVTIHDREMTVNAKTQYLQI